MSDHYKTAPEIKAKMQLEHGVSVYFHHPKEAKRGWTHWPQTEKEATPNIATQEVSPGICTNPH